MVKRMLIDATHHEETRVAVLDGNRLVEFDYESKVRKQLKGNIFLAKVTRVEPSLQAAFVNFGGNRHGFLPFSEIHPDYYRIPVSDREALMAEQRALEEAAEAEEAEAEAAELAAHEQRLQQHTPQPEIEEELPPLNDVEEIGGVSTKLELGDVPVPIDTAEEIAENDDALEEDPADSFAADHADESDAEEGDNDNDDNGHAHDLADQADDSESSESPVEEGQSGETSEGRRQGRRGQRFRRGRRYMGARQRRDEISDNSPGALHARFRRRYKIQEVIKRGQIMLIQVSKEERGNKGAAVTTYLSLPGRYCVLMPNSPRAGGVSRKIADFDARRRLKEVLSDLQIPSGMSVILRTAGMTRTQPEISRDYEYLLQTWNNIRELTLKSTAPSQIYEEGDLVKRAIRDLLSRDIDELHVAGDDGYAEAKEFMNALMPSHKNRIHHYKEEKIPLFHRYQVENQINEIGEPIVQLKSGGYIVINPTEALVAIDVNSGRATKERHIEETALKTNLEAAEEVARQLRLRDLGGLIVIDFIDMEDRRNNAKVERRLKEALANDRARIQVSRISSFGLLELSRQRLNPSLTEAQFNRCPHCQGFGFVRTVDSATIIALRALEEEGIRNRSRRVILHVPSAIAMYILNEKRDMLADIERRYGFIVTIHVDETLVPAKYLVEPLKEPAPQEEESDDGEEQPATSRRAPRRTEPVHQDLPPEGDGADEGTEPGDTQPFAREDDLDESDDDRGNRRPDEGNFADGNRSAEDARDDRGRGSRRGRRGGRNRRDNRGENRGDNRGERPPRNRGRNSSADKPAFEPAMDRQPEMQAAELVMATTPTTEKPKATYFVSKRRSSSGAESPSEAPSTAVTTGSAPSADPSPDNPPRKGWWNKLGV